MTNSDVLETTEKAPDSPESFSDIHATFGDRLTLARETLGLSPEQLAWRLGVRRATVASWEDDRAEPRANRMQTLAGVLNVSLIWLMTGEGRGPYDVAAAVRSTPGADEIIAEMHDIREQHRLLGERLVKLEARLRAILAV